MRTLMGTTNPREAAPGTIRGDLAVELTENLVHGSDGPNPPLARSPCSFLTAELHRVSSAACDRGSSVATRHLLGLAGAGRLP